MTQLYVLIPLLISLLTLVGHVVTLPWALLHKKRQPAASVAWIMAILFIPILGALGFIVFGIDRVSRRMVPRSRVTEGVSDLKPPLPEQACLIHPEAGDARRYPLDDLLLLDLQEDPFQRGYRLGLELLGSILS